MRVGHRRADIFAWFEFAWFEFAWFEFAWFEFARM